MALKPADRDQIIMNFSVPPGADDIEVIAVAALASMPDELAEYCENLAVKVEEFPDDAIQHDMELEDPYELVALYHSGSQIAPGVTKKTANDDDVLLIFRRPLLDVWCETGEDLNILIRQVLIEEIGHNFEFSEEDIEEMVQRHIQGLI